MVLLLAPLAMLSAWVTAGLVISLLLRDSSIVDIVWGIGFVVVVWTALVAGGASGPRAWLIAALTTCWGLRLALHILVRNWGRGEDFRYRKWREETGRSWWWRSYLKVFLLQGAVMWIVTLPLVAVAAGAWWTIVSPVLMTVLLLRVSGAAMLEHTLASTKPGYREYMESTSAFFPLPPRRRAGS